jgi:hypothetical protein
MRMKWAARQLACSASDVFKRLQPLAEPLQLDISLSCDLDTLDSLELTKQDYSILSHTPPYQRGGPWITGNYPATRILTIATLNEYISYLDHSEDPPHARVQAIYKRIEELTALGVKRPIISLSDLIEFMHTWETSPGTASQAPRTPQEFLRDIGGHYPYFDHIGVLGPGLPFSTSNRSLMNLSSRIRIPFVTLLDLLAPLGEVPQDLDSALRQVQLDAEQPSAIDIELTACIQRAMFCGAEHLDTELLAEARGHLYWLSDEEIQTYIANFFPLVEYARRHADAVARLSSCTGQEQYPFG